MSVHTCERGSSPGFDCLKFYYCYYNINPDNHFYRNIPTNSKYYSDQQFIYNVKSESDISFIHFNARNFNIKEFLVDLKLSFDIIAISDTWVESSTIADFSLNGYECSTYEATKKGGVALYVNQRFTCTP